MSGWTYIRKKKTKPYEGGMWNEKKRLEAVTTYLATGNLALTSRIINVPKQTMNDWIHKDWWKELIVQLQSESDIKLTSNLEKTISKSMEAVNEILENGDYHYDSKRGQVVRVPAKLRDVQKITTDLIDRKSLIRKQTAPVSQNKESTEGRLLKLAEQFAQFVLKKPLEEKVVQEVIEGEFEALPPEYKEAMIEGQ